MNKLESYKNIIVPIIEKHVPQAKIVLYGSRARRDDREGSDIDISLDNGTVIDEYVMSKVIGDLEESSLPIPFDIVDFRAVSDEMQGKIKKDGILWKE